MKKTSVLLSVLALTFIFINLGCDQLQDDLQNPRKTRNSDFYLTNSSQYNLQLESRFGELNSSDQCEPYTNSNKKTVRPNEKAHVHMQADCRGSHYSWTSVMLMTKDNIGTISLTESEQSKVISGIPIFIQTLDKTDRLDITVVGEADRPLGYDSYWSLPNPYQVGVAWLEQGTNLLHLTIPKTINQNLEIGFPFASGIGVDNPDTRLENGYYIQRLYPSEGPTYSSEEDSTRLMCDNVGCKRL